MKKVMLTLLALSIAVPAFAADIALVDNGDGTATVTYTAAAGENVRGIALEVTLTGGSLAGEATAINPEFNVYMDSAWDEETNGDGYTMGEGTPLATAGAKGPLATVAGATSFSICMGVLDEAGGQAAASEGTYDLLTLPLACDGTDPITVTIEEDTLRGGIVGDAIAEGTVAGGDVICGDGICIGDVNLNGMVNTVDLSALVTLLQNNKTVESGPFGDIVKYEIPLGHAAYYAEADINANDMINTVDLSALVTFLQNNKTVESGPFGDIVKYEVPCE